MPSSKQDRDQLVLRVDGAEGSGLRARAQVSNSKAALDLLEHLSRKGEQWTLVGASKSSPLQLTWEGPAHAIQKFLRGMRRLQSSTEAPTGFDIEALQKARRFVETLTSGIGLLEISARKCRTSVALTRDAVDNIIEILGPDRLPIRSWTSLDGHLNMIDVDGRHVFRLRSLHDRESTECRFDKQDLEAMVRLLDKRVLAEGQLTAYPGGKRVLDVEDINEIPPDEDLPNTEDFADAELTPNREDAADFIKRTRYGQK